MKVPIFISFAKRDRWAKNALLKNLETHRSPSCDFEILIYENERPGEWQDTIGRDIRRADIGVLLLSKAFNDSQPCAWEVGEILNRKSEMKIALVLLERCKYEDRFPGLATFSVLLLKTPVRRVKNRATAWQKIAAVIAKQVQEILSRTPAQRRLEESRAKLWKAIERGLFTPVLGPACRSLAQESKEAQPYLEPRLRWIINELRGAPEIGYVTSVIQANLPGSNLPPLDPEEYDEDSQPLIAFQSSLIRAGAMASRLFSEGARWNTQSFADVREMAVSLMPFKEEERGELRKRLMRATEIASALTDQKVLPGGIKTYLVWLTWSIFSQDLLNKAVPDASQVERWCYRFPLSDLWFGPPPIGEPKLSLAQLEWLADLLWYTLRFDVPIYPTSKDLALHIALCAPRPAPPQRTSAGAAAFIAGDEDRTTLVQNLWSVYSSRNSRKKGPGTLYKRLIKAVCYEPASHHSRVPPLLRDRRLSRLIISTNLDLEIERALGDANFGVLLPIWVEFERSGELRRSPDWLLVYQDQGGSKPGWMLWGDDLELNIIERTRDALKGPLVVKLYGSPLHELPGPPLHAALSTARYLADSAVNRFSHRLVLSDIDLLTYSIPKALGSLLAERGRTICFVGFSGNDLSSRRQLYELVPSEGGARVMVVGSPRDPSQSSFLKLMNIETVPLETDQISSVIGEMPGFS